MIFSNYSHIFFVPDPPHLLKTARNNLLNQKRVMWNDGYIAMQPIKDLILVSYEIFRPDKSIDLSNKRVCFGIAIL